MNYKEVIFSFQPLQPWSEILVAYLSDLDFESFEDINEGVRAYIKEDDFNFSEIERFVVNWIARLTSIIKLLSKKIGMPNGNLIFNP